MMADGALAIGASDMYSFPRKMDIFEQLAYSLQAGLDHGHRTLLRKHRQQRVQADIH